MRSKLFTLLMPLFALSAFGQDAAPEEAYLTLKEPAYSLEYPASWELQKPALMGTEFIVLSPLSSETDPFRENVNLLIQDLKGEILDLDAYVKLTEDQILALITNGELLLSERIGPKRKEYHKMIYTGDQGIFKLQYMQYFWLDDGKAYVLTFTSEIDQFPSYAPMGERILDSFNIK